MFNNIGDKIKTLAVFLFIGGMLISIVWGLDMLRNSFLMGLGTILLGGAAAWASALVLYGFGELIEETVRNREINEQVLNKLRKQIEPDAEITGAERAAAIGMHQIVGAKKRHHAWQCMNCMGFNGSEERSCKFCGEEKR